LGVNVRGLLLVLGLLSAPASADVIDISSDTPYLSAGGVGDVVNTLPGAGGAFWTMYGGAHLNHSNGSISFLDLTDASADISADVGHIYAHANSHINFSSGSSISFLNAYNNSSFNISGGSFSFLNMSGGTNLTITGFESISWINLYNGARAAFTGYELSYDGAHLTGRGMSGQQFDIWVLDFPCEVGGSCYPTGNVPAGLTLNNLGVWTGGPGAVPEPGSWALMIAGVGLVGIAMRRRQVSISFA
jgi:hypothetical protein